MKTSVLMLILLAAASCIAALGQAPGAPTNRWDQPAHITQRAWANLNLDVYVNAADPSFTHFVDISGRIIQIVWSRPLDGDQRSALMADYRPHYSSPGPEEARQRERTVKGSLVKTRADSLARYAVRVLNQIPGSPAVDRSDIIRVYADLSTQ